MRLYGIQRALVTYLLYSIMVSVVTGRLFHSRSEGKDGRTRWPSRRRRAGDKRFYYLTAASWIFGGPRLDIWCLLRERHVYLAGVETFRLPVGWNMSWCSFDVRDWELGFVRLPGPLSAFLHVKHFFNIKKLRTDEKFKWLGEQNKIRLVWHFWSNNSDWQT